jgi:hypothetical protein
MSGIRAVSTVGTLA